MTLKEIIAAHQQQWGENVDGCTCGVFVSNEAEWAAHVATEIRKAGAA